MVSTENGHSRITVEVDARHAVSAVLFTEEGKVVSSDAGGNIRWWDENKTDKRVAQSGAKISATALSPDGKWLIAGLHGPSPIVQVWDAETRQKVRDIKGHADTVTSVDVSPDSTKFATGSNDKCAMIWSIATGRRRLTWWLRHDKPVVAVRFSPSGNRVATATAHQSIRIYDSENGKKLLEIPCPFSPNLSSPLSWSVDDLQLYAASYTEVKHLDASSGSVVAKWFVPGGSEPCCIAVSQNQKFVVVAAGRTISFWDAATHEQVGPALEHASKICCLTLSNDCESIATGESDGKITIRTLHNIIPRSFLRLDKSDSSPPTPLPSPPSRFPLISISETMLYLWAHGRLTEVEKQLTEQILHPLHPSDIALALAHRALVHCRLEQYVKALEDANESIKIRPSIIGYVARAIAHAYNGQYDVAMSEFDVVLADVVSNERHLILLMKAIVMFRSGKHEGAIQRVNYLLEVVEDVSPYIAVRAYMLFFHGMMLLENGDSEQAAELLWRAQEAIPFQNGPSLIVVLLVSGWDFDTLAHDIQVQAQECIKPLEGLGDAALESKDFEKAIEQYSRVLSLRPPNPTGLFIKRSQAQAMLGSWVEALKDAHDAIEADPRNPQAYARKHAALHGLERFDEAIDAYTHMLSLIGNQDPHREKYIKPARSEAAIVNVIREVSKACPIVLIDVKTGFLCDEQKRTEIFKSEPPFKELISSMILKLDDSRIHQVVMNYFEFVTFSHVWEGKEPSFQDVQSAGSIWKLDEESPLNNKLRLFCQVVRADGCRWAWSDTCCIDKTISTILNESLTMMYKWYEASAATYAYLFDVDLESKPGHGLKDCKWMTRAWTSPELLAPKVIRFYDRNWKPYLGDTYANHKESPRIMQELVEAVHIPPEIIKAFHPDCISARMILRVASTRDATKEEDIAYSLIGMLQSDIRPHYGEGAAALGHLLEEIVTRSGDVAVLSWSGKPSSYNSCLPATLAVYNQLPPPPPTLDDAQMARCITALQASVSDEDALRVYKETTRLPPARFANRRLYLPCVIFAVKRIGLQGFRCDNEYHYRARVKGIGDVEFHTSDKLSVTEPQKLMFVYPWIRDLHAPADGFGWAGMNTPREESSESESEDESSPRTSSNRPLRPIPRTVVDQSTRALRLLVRLQQPFHALLLEQRRHGVEFKRVATDHEIVVPRLNPVPFLKHFATKVVEIL